MIYSDKAKQFVDGLRTGIKGTVYEPAGMMILSQWIYESGHFRSKLAQEFNNAGGMKYRPGFPLPHGKTSYEDWEAQKDAYFVLPKPEDYFSLWKWFIERDNRYDVARAELKKTGKPEDFIFHLADCGYCASIPNPITSAWHLFELASKAGIHFADYILPDHDGDDVVTGQTLISWNYVIRIADIANRPQTKELYECAWTDRAASLLGSKPVVISVSDEQVQSDREWLNTEVEIDIVTGKKVGE